MRQRLSRSHPASFRAWQTLPAILAILLLAAELFALHWLVTPEARLADYFMRRHAAEQKADSDIVIVDIDDASLAAMQDIAGLWPWPREVFADLLISLNRLAPRAVVFDLAFAERDPWRPKSDARLSDAVKAMPNVYLAAAHLGPARERTGIALTEVSSAFGMQRVSSGASATAALMLPQAIERSGWRLGLTNSMEDEDGVLRRYRLHSELDGWMLPSLPARVAADLGAVMPRQSSFLMRWPEQGHQRYAFGELYRLLTEQLDRLNPQERRTLDTLFRDKIVVIGASAASSFDHHLTPMKAGYPGVDILAVALDNLMNEDSVRSIRVAWPFCLGAGMILMLAFAFSKRMNPLMIGAALVLVSFCVLVVADTMLGQNVHVPVMTPLVFAWIWFICAAIAGYLRERRTRDQAVALFGRFLNPEVVRQIVGQGQTVETMSGRTCDITVLFSDIRHFTSISESRPPQEIVALLNRYFERQVDVVFRHGGTLDKFIGDCIMAFWGAPLDDPRHACRAVAAALEMQDNLLAFKKELLAEGWDAADFDVGIGVHTGAAVVGFIGAQRKLEYTAIGDTVNLASRVEGLTKDVARVLVTHATVQACGTVEEFEFKPRGAFPVKGRAAEVKVYEPVRKR